MKNLIFAFILTVSCLFASCAGKNTTENNNDSSCVYDTVQCVEVDSTDMVCDTISGDSMNVVCEE